jgi:hypothetical protein
MKQKEPKNSRNKNASSYYASHCPLLFPAAQLCSGEIGGFIFGWGACLSVVV